MYVGILRGDSTYSSFTRRHHRTGNYTRAGGMEKGKKKERKERKREEFRPPSCWLCMYFRVQYSHVGIHTLYRSIFELNLEGGGGGRSSKRVVLLVGLKKYTPLYFPFFFSFSFFFFFGTSSSKMIWRRR